MALFHSHIQIISRSSGRSCVAAAAYRAGECITNERDGITHDFSRRSGVDHSEIILPSHALEAWHDRERLWNDVELDAKQENSQLAREINYALPRELSFDEQVRFAREYAQVFADAGMVVDFAIHDADGANPHVHQMMTMKPCDENGFTAKQIKTYLVRKAEGEELYATADELKSMDGDWSKVYAYKDGQELTQAQAEELGLNPTKDRKSRYPLSAYRSTVDWDAPEKAQEWRALLADIQNRYLAEIGSEERVSHLSYEARGIDQISTKHEGSSVAAIEAKAERDAAIRGQAYAPVTDKRQENQDIRQTNELLKQVEAAIRKAGNTMMQIYKRVRASVKDKKSSSSARARYVAGGRSSNLSRGSGRSAGLQR